MLLANKEANMATLEILYFEASKPLPSNNTIAVLRRNSY
jgi:hypothetical protein